MFSPTPRFPVLITCLSAPLRAMAKFLPVLLLVLCWTTAAQAAIPASERAVLLDLYNSTNGANWDNKSWHNSPGWGGAAGTECSWFGVECSGNHVVRISLYGNNLVGTLPSLDGLMNLQYFSVGYNQLSGTIPALDGLTSLQVFDVSVNQLSGPIPALDGITNLLDFDVTNNQLTGTIPALDGMTNLRYFNVGYNQLSGTIPSLSGLTALRFDASNNQLTGTIPALDGMTNLQYFNVSDNQLTGSIPALDGVTTLSYFDVSNNQLTGTIPSLSGLTALWYFDVSRNRLTGSIPSLDGLRTQGGIFWVSDNQLAGPVPAPPAFLLHGKSNLCRNSLTTSGNAAIDAAWATAQARWAWGVIDGDWLSCQNGASASTYTLTVSLSGSGSVTSSPSGIACGINCTENYAAGTAVTLTATPDSGYIFIGWRGSACIGFGACSVYMSQAEYVEAYFLATNLAAEFYKGSIDHYFITANSDEATYLDSNTEWSWKRTGKTYNVWLTQEKAPANASPVCRFYGEFANGTVGSHFYTIDTDECEYVKSRTDWGWGYEGIAFYAVKPVGNACPAGTSPIYRAYNNGKGGAPNHRYMTSLSEVDSMVVLGWVSEGLVFCEG